MSDHAGPVAAKPRSKPAEAGAWVTNPAYDPATAGTWATNPAYDPAAGNGAATLLPDGANASGSLRAGQLRARASVLLSVEITAGRRKVIEELRHSLGVGGARFYRSDEVRAFRQQMKDAARARAVADIAQLSPSDDHGPATRQYLSLIARGEAYGLSKESVDEQLSDDAEGWVQRHWDAEDSRFEQAELPAITQAMWAVLSASPDDPKLNAKAMKVGEQLARKAVATRTARANAAAKAWKNTFIKPDEDDDIAVSEAATTRGWMANEVAARTSGNEVGKRAMEASIKANSTAEGLNIIGRMLDKVIPQPGDNVELSVELTIPIPNSPAFVTLKVEGKAGRGTTGFTTAGFASLGDAKRLELMTKISVGAGVGAKLLGLDVSAGGSIGFFVRSGANEGTKAAMTALSYGAYRSATALSRQFGNWWAGNGNGVDEGKTQRSEIWAAMVEEMIFAKDGSAFADLGGSGALTATAKGDVGAAGLEAEAELAAEVFRRYDQLGLKASLGDEFWGRAVGSKDDAKDRREAAAGRTVASFGVSTEVKATIAGQSVSFAASFSGEKAAGSGQGFWKNWGVTIGAGLSMPPGADTTIVDQMVGGLVAGVLSAAQNVGRTVQKGSKEGGGGDIAMGALDTTSDLVRVLDSGFENQLSTSLNEALTSGGEGVFSPESSLEVVFTFGRTGGDWNIRVEVLETKKLTINANAGNVGIEAEVSRGKRVFSFGYEHKEDPDDADATVGVWKLEMVGLRPRSKRSME